jgi:hypothetical protein
MKILFLRGADYVSMAGKNYAFGPEAGTGFNAQRRWAESGKTAGAEGI